MPDEYKSDDQVVQQGMDLVLGEQDTGLPAATLDQGTMEGHTLEVQTLEVQTLEGHMEESECLEVVQCMDGQSLDVGTMEVETMPAQLYTGVSPETALQEQTVTTEVVAES